MKAGKILAEETPNPLALRISYGSDILQEDGWLQYFRPEEAGNSPLASRLLFFRFIQAVYIRKDFFTILRHPDYEWEHIIEDIREAVDLFIESGLPGSYDPVLKESSSSQEEQAVIEVLQGSIRAATSNDGGELVFQRLENGNRVVLSPKGACMNCPHLLDTVKKGIEPAFSRHFGFIQEVVWE
jgi:Fe-S cluster biogenesis protein NfuA